MVTTSVHTKLLKIAYKRRRIIVKFLIAIVVVFTGCTFVSETQNPDTLPQLVYRTALPRVPTNWSNAPPKMEVLLQVSRTGEVCTREFYRPYRK